MLHLTTQKSVKDCVKNELEAAYNINCTTIDGKYKVIRELSVLNVSEELTFCRKNGYLAEIMMRTTYAQQTKSHINNSSSNLRHYVVFVHMGQQSETLFDFRNVYFEFEITDSDNFNFYDFVKNNVFIILKGI